MRTTSSGIILLIFFLGSSSYAAGIGEPQAITADELVDQIGKGSSVAYNNVVICGDLDLSGPELLKDSSSEIIDSPISITGSIFEGDLVIKDKTFRSSLILDNNIFHGNVSFFSSRFANKTSFNGSTFNSSATFSRARFLREIGLRGCLFKKECNFAATSFEKAASFKDTMFISESNFRGATFKDDLEFENISSKNLSMSFFNASFLKGVNFRRSRLEGEGIQFVDADFNGPVTFGGSTLNNFDLSRSNFNDALKILNIIFTGHADFGDAIFNGDVAIYESDFNGDVDLIKSKFRQQASFKASTFNGSVFFEKAEFERRAQFSDAEFVGPVDFTDCIFREDAIFEGAQLRSTLNLKRAEYKKMFIRWENITHLNFDDSTFLLLIENFKKLGFWSDADQCYYTYRLERNRFLEPPIYRPVDRMLSILYGYGTKPERPIFGFAFAIIIFGIIFYGVGGIRRAGKKASIWDAILFSATNIASGARGLSEFVSAPSEFMVVGRFQCLVIMEKFLGMLLFALFLTALARTVIR